MELLKSVRKRSFLSEVAYVILNILLAVALLVAVLVTNVPWPALGIILLSKWRVFAVRSRYWMANIRANMIDTIVGVSVVVMLSTANGSLSTQLSLVALYIAWLLFIKPRSKRSFVAAQAMIGLVFGIAALVQISPSLPASVVVAGAWLVAYSAARHILSVQHETHLNFLSLLWGFIVAEIMWLSYHWTIGYAINPKLQLAQATIIVAILSFLAERMYVSYHKHGSLNYGELVLPVLMSMSVIVVLLFFFSGAATI